MAYTNLLEFNQYILTTLLDLVRKSDAEIFPVDTEHITLDIPLWIHVYDAVQEGAKVIAILSSKYVVYRYAGPEITILSPQGDTIGWNDTLGYGDLPPEVELDSYSFVLLDDIELE